MLAIKKQTAYPTIKDFFGILDGIFEIPLTNDSISCKTPIHDVIENENEFIIEIVLAGIKKEDINIDIENNELNIKAERKEKNNLKYNRKETYFGKYERCFSLPDNIDNQNIDASFNDGILIITIPKNNDYEKINIKKIEIK